MKTVQLVMSLLIISFQGFADDPLSSFFQQSDAFMHKWVKEGKVNYPMIKENFQEIDDLYKKVNQMDLKDKSDDEKKAFYINAYNLAVIFQVTKYYPLKSPLDQSGFFDKVKHAIAGESMTLNYLEIRKILLPYKDARVHFALACAAIGCPKLASFAFMPDELDNQLENRTKLALNNQDFIKVKNSEKRVEVSKIFDWYKKDFTNDGSTTILAFINQFRDKKIPDNFSVEFYEYDWNLNGVGK